MQNALRRVTESEEFARLVAEVRGGARIISVGGLTSAAARALAVAALRRETKKRLAIVVATNQELEAWERDVRFWNNALHHERDDGARRSAATAVLTLPSSETDPYAGASPHAETLERPRVDAVAAGEGRRGFRVALGARIVRRTMRPARDSQEGARRGAMRISRRGLIERYRLRLFRETRQRRGRFSLRGGILDVGRRAMTRPVRIEFSVIRLIRYASSIRNAALDRAVETGRNRADARTGGDGEDFRRGRMRASVERRTLARALKDRTVYADEGKLFPVGVDDPRSAGTAATSSIILMRRCSSWIAGRYRELSRKFFETLAARYADCENADEPGLRRKSCI